MTGAALGMAMAALVGCTNEIDIGDPCARVRVNEIATANEEFPITPTSTSDWFELYNFGEEWIDMAGYVLQGHQQEEPAYVFPRDDPGLDAGEYRAFIASTYDITDTDLTVTHFDFNNDKDTLLFWGPAPDHYLCETVKAPDLHYDVPWERDPEDPSRWCDDSVPTPGAANSPCLCDVNDGC